MKLTVCEMPHDWLGSEAGWNTLAADLEARASEWVLLPEMPFYRWLAGTHAVDPDRWRSAVDAHDFWIRRLPELPVRAVIGSRPVIAGGRTAAVVAGAFCVSSNFNGPNIEGLPFGGAGSG